MGPLINHRGRVLVTGMTISNTCQTYYDNFTTNRRILDTYIFSKGLLGLWLKTENRLLSQVYRDEYPWVLRASSCNGTEHWYGDRVFSASRIMTNSRHVRRYVGAREPLSAISEDGE